MQQCEPSHLGLFCVCSALSSPSGGAASGPGKALQLWKPFGRAMRVPCLLLQAPCAGLEFLVLLAEHREHTVVPLVLTCKHGSLRGERLGSLFSGVVCLGALLLQRHLKRCLVLGKKFACSCQLSLGVFEGRLQGTGMR